MKARTRGLTESRSFGNPERVKNRRTPPGEQQSADRSKHGQQHGFGEPLANETRAAGADRDPHGYFAASRRGARQQQARNIRAGDKQNQRQRRPTAAAGWATCRRPEPPALRRARRPCTRGCDSRRIRMAESPIRSSPRRTSPGRCRTFAKRPTIFIQRSPRAVKRLELPSERRRPR